MNNKKKIQESITNLSNMGIIPADEVQLNLDVIYNSVLNDVCSVIPMESPRQIISCLKLVYDSENKSLIDSLITGDIDKDIYKILAMNGVGAVPFNDNGYPSRDVHCTLITNAEGLYLADYQNILPNTIDIAGEIFDDGNGNLVKKDGTQVGNVDYIKGIFKFISAIPANAVLNYKFDIYNLLTNRNFIKFVKASIEIFADMYQLDVDSALVLNDFKGLDLKDNIDNIIPQVLTQQIDQYILNKYFKQAELNGALNNKWSSEVKWNGLDRVPVNMLYDDLGSFIDYSIGQFVIKHGVLPNVILVTPLSYSILSSNKKFVADNRGDTNAGTPKFVGYYNNTKVILTNNPASYDEVSIVLTYKGQSDAQAAGVYTPYIPVSLRTVNGAEAGGMITTTNAYSISGFTMTNPDLVEGITITK